MVFELSGVSDGGADDGKGRENVPMMIRLIFASFAPSWLSRGEFEPD